MNRVLCAALVALLATGCEEELKPETVVDGLRVLGVRAEPPDLRPGETAALEALVLDPSRPGGATTVLWLACDPDPFDLGRSACSDPAVLQDPSTLSPSGENAALPPGVRFVGFGTQATYTPPANLFEVLTPGDERRRSGTVAQLLLLAVAEAVSPLATEAELRALFERVQRQEVASLVTLFRVRVSEDVVRNQNPVLGALEVNGASLPANATLRLLPDIEATLNLTAPDASFEVYEQRTPQGTVEARTERLLAAWYATSGRFSAARLALRSDLPLSFTPPGTAKDPMPAQREGALYAVVRDTRGGQTWTQVPFYVCDPALPVPQVTSVAPAAAPPGALVRLTGENLGALLEVRLGGAVLPGGTADASGTTYEAFLPLNLPPGDLPLELLGKSCADAAGPTVTVLSPTP